MAFVLNDVDEKIDSQVRVRWEKICDCEEKIKEYEEVIKKINILIRKINSMKNECVEVANSVASNLIISGKRIDYSKDSGENEIDKFKGDLGKKTEELNEIVIKIKNEVETIQKKHMASYNKAPCYRMITYKGNR